MDRLTHLFVYGTLLSPKKWAEPQDVLNFPRAAPFIREIHPATLEGAELFDFGSHPGAYPGIGTIIGEVHVIDPLAFEVLDPLEGHPKIYYRQKTIANIRDAELVRAWIYWAPEEIRAAGKKIPNGDWLRRHGTADK